MQKDDCLVYSLILFLQMIYTLQLVKMRLKQLEEEAAVSFWEKADDNHTIIRLATSWATKEEEIKALIEIL